MLSPDEKELWVTDDVFDLIRIVRLSDMKEIGQIQVGHFPHWFTMRPDGKVAFVSLWYSDVVRAIDVATHKVLAQHAVRAAERAQADRRRAKGALNLNGAAGPAEAMREGGPAPPIKEEAPRRDARAPCLRAPTTGRS